MLKINLLPKSINIARQRNVAIGVVTVLVAAEVGILLFMRQAPLKHRDDLNARKAEVESHLTELQGVKTKADAVLALESALAPKYDFLTNMVKYNKQEPTLYRRIAGYTYSEATFLNLEASANQVKFDAYVANPTDASRLLLGLSKSPDLQGLPAITGIPGWDDAAEAKRKADEKTAESNNNLPEAGSGVIGAAGRPGGAGAPGGYPGGMAGGYPGGMSGGYPGGSSGGYPGGSPMASSGSSSFSTGAGYPGGSMGGGGGYPGGSMGGQGGGGDISKFKLTNARRKPRGFTVNVTCALKTPLSSRPSYADSDAQAGSGGGGGGGGYPGGGGFSGGFSGGGSSGGPPGGYPGAGGYPGRK